MCWKRLFSVSDRRPGSSFRKLIGCYRRDLRVFVRQRSPMGNHDKVNHSLQQVHKYAWQHSNAYKLRPEGSSWGGCKARQNRHCHRQSLLAGHKDERSPYASACKATLHFRCKSCIGTPAPNLMADILRRPQLPCHNDWAMSNPNICQHSSHLEYSGDQHGSMLSHSCWHAKCLSLMSLCKNVVLRLYNQTFICAQTSSEEAGPQDRITIWKFQKLLLHPQLPNCSQNCVLNMCLLQAVLICVLALAASCLSHHETRKESIRIWLRCDTTQGMTAKPMAPGSTVESCPRTVTAMGRVFWLPTSIRARLSPSAAPSTDHALRPAAGRSAAS